VIPVAVLTNKRNEYVLNKGFDDDDNKRRILQRLELGSAFGRELRNLIWSNLPQSLSEASKEIKVKNLRTALRLHGLNGKRIEIDPAGSQRGSASIWRIKSD
jgi:hypothetical protein